MSSAQTWPSSGADCWPAVSLVDTASAVALGAVAVTEDHDSIGHRLCGSRDANMLSKTRFFSNSRNFSSWLCHKYIHRPCILDIRLLDIRYCIHAYVWMLVCWWW